MAKRSILITGCSSGIGLDAARTMHGRGWQVFATCRKPEDCDRLRAEGLTSLPLDYTDTAGMHATLEAILEQTGGRLDALFNNGAFACLGAVEDLPTDALRAIFETNLFGYHELTRAVIPVMRKQGSGRIVNCSSILGLVGSKWRGAYVATKFAMEGLSDVLRLEMRGTGIEIILIEPGPIATKIRANAIPHFERWIDWKASARRAEYEPLLDRLYKPATKKDAFELPASAVTAKLIHAIEAPRPRARYYVTTPTYLAGFLRRLLPTRALDAVLLRR